MNRGDSRLRSLSYHRQRFVETVHWNLKRAEYIEVFYNRQRCHSANGYLAPLAYEQALKTNEILCPEKC